MVNIESKPYKARVPILGMNQILQTKKGSYCTSIVEISEKQEKTRILVSNTKDNIRKMISKGITAALKKGNSVSWNEDTNSKVTIYNITEEVSNESATYKKYLMTETKNGKIKHHIKTCKNPNYENNAECEICFKQTSQKLKSINLFDDEKTIKQVCNRCDKNISHVRKRLEVLN